MEACQEEPPASDASCPPDVRVVIGAFERSAARACRMEVGLDFSYRGMSAWRWILFFVVFWPLEFIGHGLARIIAGITSALASVENVRTCLSPTYALLVRSPERQT